MRSTPSVLEELDVILAETKAAGLTETTTKLEHVRSDLATKGFLPAQVVLRPVGWRISIDGAFKLFVHHEKALQARIDYLASIGEGSTEADPHPVFEGDNQLLLVASLLRSGWSLTPPAAK